MPDTPFIDWEDVGVPDAPRRRRRTRRGFSRTTVIGATFVAAGAISTFAVAAPALITDQPLHIKTSSNGGLLRAVNTGVGRAALLECSNGASCLFVKNRDGGPAANFVVKPGEKPFRVSARSARVTHLDADLLDGQHADQIIRAAVEKGAGGRQPSGPAGGDLAGTYPNPTLTGGSIDSAALFVDELRDGPADAPGLRSLGTGARQAVAGNDARLSDARTPTGAAAGDLTGSFPNPTLGAGSVDALNLFTDDVRDGAADSATLRTLGTGANQAAAGDDPRFSDPRPPGGAAGGDLAGSYPNPTLAEGSVDALNLFTDDVRDGAAGSATLRSLGTGANQAAAGDDARLSNARTPTGSAGGDLTGTYPNPTLGAGSIDALSLFTNAVRDGAAGSATLRTLGTGANQAAAGNDARLSDARTPTGSAGGSLEGDYPNPTLAGGSVGTAQVADGSLRLADMAVLSTTVALAPTPIAANTCVQLALTGFTPQAGDVVEVYPPVDGTANSNGVQWSSGIQDGDGTMLVTACNNNSSAASVGGSVRVLVLRP